MGIEIFHLWVGGQMAEQIHPQQIYPPYPAPVISTPYTWLEWDGVERDSGSYKTSLRKLRLLQQFRKFRFWQSSIYKPFIKLYKSMTPLIANLRNYCSKRG